MIKIIVFLFRYFVGALFIFSGLIKLNDPIGFSFKLEEYFGPTVFDLDFEVIKSEVFWGDNLQNLSDKLFKI